MGKEWYRFPSNFFLPSNNWNVKFIKSEFKGQLPQPFLTEKAHATAIERPNFNNLNLEELDRYVKVNGILLPKLFLPTVRKNCSKGVFFQKVRFVFQISKSQKQYSKKLSWAWSLNFPPITVKCYWREIYFSSSG